MKFFNLFCAVLLLVALAPMPSEYYTYLRIPVTVVAAVIALRELNARWSVWSITFLIIAIIFNPIVPVYFYERAIWLPIDILAAFIFLLYTVMKDQKRNFSKKALQFFYFSKSFASPVRFLQLFPAMRCNLFMASGRFPANTNYK